MIIDGERRDRAWMDGWDGENLARTRYSLRGVHVLFFSFPSFFLSFFACSAGLCSVRACYSSPIHLHLLAILFRFRESSSFFYYTQYQHDPALPFPNSPFPFPQLRPSPSPFDIRPFFPVQRTESFAWIARHPAPPPRISGEAIVACMLACCRVTKHGKAGGQRISMQKKKNRKKKIVIAR
ncbi:hypothetical protein BDR22DRAFT_146331 [Usnea florida]